MEENITTFNPGLLTRDAILSAQDHVYEIVEVPEWGGSVRVRGLTGSERDQFEAGMIQYKGKRQEVNQSAMSRFRARLVSMTIVDGDGKRLFNSSDVEALGAKSAKALQRVFNVAQRLSGFTESDVQELTEELAENPTEGSSTDSA